CRTRGQRGAGEVSDQHAYGRSDDRACGIDRDAERTGCRSQAVLDAVSATAIWNAHLARDAESMLTGNFETQFPVRLLEKDLGYPVNTAGGDAAAPTVSAVRDVFRKAIDQGLGDLNMTAVEKLFVTQHETTIA